MAGAAGARALSLSAAAARGPKPLLALRTRGDAVTNNDATPAPGGGHTHQERLMPTHHTGGEIGRLLLAAEQITRHRNRYRTRPIPRFALSLQVEHVRSRLRRAGLRL